MTQPNLTLKQQHTLALTLAIIVLPLAGVNILDIHNGAMIALFTSVVILWLTEVIPLPATGLLIPCLAVAYGISDSTTAFSAFGNQILFLFIGAFLLGKAIEKHGWDKRIAYRILASRAGASSPDALTGIVALTCWCLSMWISNTTACIIAVPIALSILNTLKSNFSCEQHYQHFSIRLLLVCAFASSIGGLATPVGTPPNLLALQYLNQQGIHLSFIEWMMMGLPVSFAMLLALLVIMKKRFPVPDINLHHIRQQFTQQHKNLGNLKPAEKQVAACFLLAISLWVLPGLLTKVFPSIEFLSQLSLRLPMGGVAIFSALILFCLPVNSSQQKNLTWHDAKEIDWGIILLFGGGLCLGSLLSQTGLAKEIGDLIFNQSTLTVFTAGLLIIAAGIVLSEFSSNTASTAIILPIVVTTFAAMGDTTLTQLVVATAFGASYGFMLPVSTPPNAVVYSTGKVPLQQMIRTGLIFDITGFAIIALMMLLILPSLGVV